MVEKAAVEIKQNSKCISDESVQDAISTQVFEQELSLILKNDQGITIPQMLTKLYESDTTGDLKERIKTQEFANLNNFNLKPEHSRKHAQVLHRTSILYCLAATCFTLWKRCVSEIT